MKQPSGKYGIGHALEYAVQFATVNVIDKPDGMGGVITVYEDGILIDVDFQLNQSSAVLIAEQKVFSDVFSAVVDESAPVKAGDVIRRLEQDDYFRVESAPDDDTSAPFNMDNTKRFTAKKYTLPSDVKIIKHFDAQGNYYENGI